MGVPADWDRSLGVLLRSLDRSFIGRDGNFGIVLFQHFFFFLSLCSLEDLSLAGQVVREVH